MSDDQFMGAQQLTRTKKVESDLFAGGQGQINMA